MASYRSVLMSRSRRPVVKVTQVTIADVLRAAVLPAAIEANGWRMTPGHESDTWSYGRRDPVVAHHDFIAAEHAALLRGDLPDEVEGTYSAPMPTRVVARCPRAHHSADYGRSPDVGRILTGHPRYWRVGRGTDRRVRVVVSLATPCTACGDWSHNQSGNGPAVVAGLVQQVRVWARAHSIRERELEVHGLLAVVHNSGDPGFGVRALIWPERSLTDLLAHSRAIFAREYLARLMIATYPECGDWTGLGKPCLPAGVLEAALVRHYYLAPVAEWWAYLVRALPLATYFPDSGTTTDTDGAGTGPDVEPSGPSGPSDPSGEPSDDSEGGEPAASEPTASEPSGPKPEPSGPKSIAITMPDGSKRVAHFHGGEWRVE